MLNDEDNRLLTQVENDAPMGKFVRRFWIPFLEASKLQGPDSDPVEVRLLGEDLVAWRDSFGRFSLIENRCPHRSAPLFYARCEEAGLRCIYHGWKFDVTGQCIEMPSEPPASNFKDKIRAKAYPVRELGGILWTYMGPPELDPELPHLEWAHLKPSQVNVVRYEQNCNWVQALEGDIDSSHISFLHKSNYRSASDSEEQLRIADTAPRFYIEPTDYGIMLAAERTVAGDEDSRYWRVNHWLMPFHTFIATDLELKRAHGHIWVPVDDHHTQVWCVIWAPREDLTERERYEVLAGPEPHIASLDPATGKLRANHANHFLQDRRLQRTSNFTGIVGVREQDTAVVEGMGAIVDRSIEHLGSSDTAIIAMRRRLLKEATSLAEGVEPVAPQDGSLYAVRPWSAIVPTGMKFDDNRVEELNAALA